jgi:hypothetical protein
VNQAVPLPPAALTARSRSHGEPMTSDRRRQRRSVKDRAAGAGQSGSVKPGDYFYNDCSGIPRNIVEIVVS